MTYFAPTPNTLDELKKAYRRLAMQHHPDRGGTKEAMQAINAEYEKLFAVLKDKHNAAADDYHKTTEAPEEFIEIIDKLMSLDGLEIELCGSWLWIGGNTRENKDALKAMGCYWSSNKKLWYWRHPEDGCYRRGKKSKTMSEIRTKYGSQTFKGGREESSYDRIGA